jgi:hypothetical protein
MQAKKQYRNAHPEAETSDGSDFKVEDSKGGSAVGCSPDCARRAMDISRRAITSVDHRAGSEVDLD